MSMSSGNDMNNAGNTQSHEDFVLFGTSSVDSTHTPADNQACIRCWGQKLRIRPPGKIINYDLADNIRALDEGLIISYYCYTAVKIPLRFARDANV